MSSLITEILMHLLEVICCVSVSMIGARCITEYIL